MDGSPNEKFIIKFWSPVVQNGQYAKRLGIVLDLFCTEECADRYLKVITKEYRSDYILLSSPHKLLSAIEKIHRDKKSLDYNDYLSKGRLEKIKARFIENIKNDRIFFRILEGDKIIIWEVSLFSKNYVISK